MSGAPNDAAPQRLRPTQAELLEQWERYFADPLLSLAVLRGEAEQGTLDDKRGLRSLSWRVRPRLCAVKVCCQTD